MAGADGTGGWRGMRERGTVGSSTGTGEGEELIEPTSLCSPGSGCDCARMSKADCGESEMGELDSAVKRGNILIHVDVLLLDEDDCPFLPLSVSSRSFSSTASSSACTI